MAIVSISRGANSHGAEVAEKAAARLGYSCLAREAVLEAAGLYRIPEAELIDALDRAPSFLERSVGSRDRYVGALEATVLQHFAEDNVVYHGFAGHYFARNIAGALKVRILAEPSARATLMVVRDNLTEKEARRLLKKKDAARRRWNHYLYGVDPEDPSLYDIILHVGKMGVSGAAEIICTLAQNEQFRTSAAALGQARDLALAAAVKVRLADKALEFDIIDISASQGVLNLCVRELEFARQHAGSMDRSRRLRQLRQLVQARTAGLPGLQKVSVSYPDSEDEP